MEDGAVTGEIRDGAKLDRNEWIYWKDEVHDFELTLEYRITDGPSANSGIQIRCQRDNKRVASGLQGDLDDGAVWLGRIHDEQAAPLSWNAERVSALRRTAATGRIRSRRRSHFKGFP